MSNNDDKNLSLMRYPPDGVISFGDRSLDVVRRLWGGFWSHMTVMGVSGHENDATGSGVKKGVKRGHGQTATLIDIPRNPHCAHFAAGSGALSQHARRFLHLHKVAYKA